MAETTLPTAMRKWQYHGTDGGIENHLKLATSEPLPVRKPDQHLIQVFAVSLNPVDFKPVETPIARFMLKLPVTPGFDFAGRLVTPADGSKLEPGQLVYGAASLNPFGGGGLAEYISVADKTIAPLAPDTSSTEMAGAPIAAVTAYDSLVPFIKEGSRVFINGGSGGVGTYAIQIAKAHGAHVTVSCSARNTDLCRSLGADEVLDYSASPLLSQLQKLAPFDHVVDNVFSNGNLYFQAHTYSTSTAKFAEVAAAPSLKFIRFAFWAFLMPAFLGGGRRKLALIAGDVNTEKLTKIGALVKEGKVRNVVDSQFVMEDAVEAFKRLKTGRARGKILIEVAKDKQ